MEYILGFCGIMVFGWAMIGYMIYNDHKRKGGL